MPRFRTSCFQPSLFLALALCAALLAPLAGCDTDDAADDADRERLRGSWYITDLRVDGADEFASLDIQYPNAVLFRLRVDENENEIFLARSTNDAGDFLLREFGTFDVDAGDTELDIASDNYGIITLDYDFGGEPDMPERVVLTADRDSDAEDLVALLGLEGLGDVGDAQIAIERRRRLTTD